MGEVVNIYKSDHGIVEKFLEEVKEGNVTHGVIAYRCKDGSLENILINPEHSTYLVGLLERVKMELLKGE
jgi:hypothetical protein